MSLGEKLEVTIGSKWAYRKAGLQDDNGKYLVPPNAVSLSLSARANSPIRGRDLLCASHLIAASQSLHFEMRLVQVRDKAVDP